MAKKSAAATNKARYEQIAEELAAPITEEAGVYIYDVDYHKEGEDFLLCVYIDKEGGVTIDDCETVSRALSDVLDEKDPIPDAYTLIVSSPGLGRTLTKDRHFANSIGEETEIKLYKPLEGTKQKEFVGILVDGDSNAVTIETEEGERMVFPRKDIAVARLTIDF